MNACSSISYGTIKNTCLRWRSAPTSANPPCCSTPTSNQQAANHHPQHCSQRFPASPRPKPTQPRPQATSRSLTSTSAPLAAPATSSRSPTRSASSPGGRPSASASTTCASTAEASGPKLDRRRAACLVAACGAAPAARRCQWRPRRGDGVCRRTRVGPARRGGFVT